MNTCRWPTEPPEAGHPCDSVRVDLCKAESGSTRPACSARHAGKAHHGDANAVPVALHVAFLPPARHGHAAQSKPSVAHPVSMEGKCMFTFLNGIRRTC